MGIIRGKVHHPNSDGGRGLTSLGLGSQTIQVGESPWNYCAEHDKYYDKKTGEEVQVKKQSLMELLEDCKLPCCKK